MRAGAWSWATLMDRGRVDDTIRRAIGGDVDSVAWISSSVDTTDDAIVMVVAALLGSDPATLDRARSVATTSRDRQVVEIARAHLLGRVDQVDALARDHLVDHPDSVLVAWIASGATLPGRRAERH
jgi:hypothetical protein